MKSIQVTYTITVQDYRNASYYIASLQHRRALQVLAVFLAGGLIYLYGLAARLWTVHYLAVFVLAAYLIWGLVFFAGIERNIRKYLLSPECMVGCTFSALLESNHLYFQVPERNIRHSCAVNRLTAVFELSRLFLLFISPQELYILPKRALSTEEIDELCESFSKRLPDRFSAQTRKKRSRLS